MPPPTRVIAVPVSPPQAVPVVSAEHWPVTDRVPGVGVVLAHGAGSTRSNPLLRTVAAGLQAAGHPALLFNFGYSEAGRKSPDPPARLLSAWADVAAAAPALLGVRGPLVLGGRSMGGRIATLAVAEETPAAGLLLLAYPLHPPGRKERLRTEHWPTLRVPLLFVHGDRDTFNDLELFARERTKLAGAEVGEHLLSGADHGFRVRRADGHDQAAVLPAVVAATVRWLATLRAPHGPPPADRTSGPDGEAR